MTPSSDTSQRFPIRRDLDGDFALADLTRLAAQAGAAPTSLHPGLDVTAYDNQVWRLDRPIDDGHLLGSAPPSQPLIGEPSRADEALLHAFEIGGLWRPPVTDNLHGLDAPRACVWLALASRWTLLAHTSGDLRLLNTACKLYGAVWARSHHATGDGRLSVPGPLAHTARLISDATRYITDRLRPATPAPATVGASMQQPAQTVTSAAQQPILVLAGAGSAGAAQFLTALPRPSPITAVCWYDAPDVAVPSDSAYGNAWYPPEPAGSTPAPPRPSGLREHTARDWNEVAEVLQAYRAGLVVLIGMPIVPTPVLHHARLGVINAHNGALPHYRGMDAVGWAVLNNDPIVCTAHLAAPAVDQGDILATTTIAYTPASTLRQRVKTAQLDLLSALTMQTAATGRLPLGTPQAAGRQFYRLHPHLKRVLDACTDHLNERV
jgi:hypothetical protein